MSLKDNEVSELTDTINRLTQSVNKATEGLEAVTNKMKSELQSDIIAKPLPTRDNNK